MENNNNTEGWSGVVSGFLGVLFICCPIGFICSLFSKFLAIIFWLILPILGLGYFIYDEFGTKEKRELHKERKRIANEERHKQLYNDDGTKKSKQQIQQEKAQEELNRINSLGVYPTKIINFDFIAKPIVYIDTNNKKMLIKTTYKEYVINFDDIIDFELKIDDISQFRYTLGTAITGAFKTSTIINNISVFIYLNNIDIPYIEVGTLGDKTYNTNVFDGQKFADELIGVLKYIKNNK